MSDFHCHGCNKPLEKTWSGPDPKWCSERCRRAQYAGACVDCGKATNGHDGPGHAAKRCVACTGKFNTRWTPDTIVDAIRAWVTAHGTAPKATDWIYGGDDSHPAVHTVQRVCGSWNAGIAAAGVTPRAVGTYGRSGEDPAVVERTVQLYRSGLSLARVAEILGVSDNTVAYRLEKAGCPRRSLREAQALRRVA